MGLADQIKKLYNLHTIGGHAHIVLEDYNVEDENIDFCIEAAKKNVPHLDFEMRTLAIAILRSLKEMPYAERELFLREVSNQIHNEWTN